MSTNRARDFAALLVKGYERWRRERIAEGARPADVSQVNFCELYGFKPGNFSGWITAPRIPTDLGNIMQLARCPYIGPKVYDIIGLDFFQDKDLAAVITAWPDMTPDQRQRILDFVHANVNQEVLASTT